MLAGRILELARPVAGERDLALRAAGASGRALVALLAGLHDAVAAGARRGTLAQIGSRSATVIIRQPPLAVHEVPLDTVIRAGIRLIDHPLRVPGLAVGPGV